MLSTALPRSERKGGREEKETCLSSWLAGCLSARRGGGGSQPATSERGEQQAAKLRAKRTGGSCLARPPSLPRGGGLRPHFYPRMGRGLLSIVVVVIILQGGWTPNLHRASWCKRLPQLD